MFESRTVLHAGQAVAQVVAGWTAQRRDLRAHRPDHGRRLGGPVVKTLVKAAIPRGPATGRGWRAGTKLGYLTVSTPGGLQGVHNLKLDGFLPSAPAGWSASVERHRRRRGQRLRLDDARPGPGLFGQSRPGL